jgi:phosphoglycerate dehydrogenase-like enzyme
MTPHVAGVTEDAKAAISAISVGNALDFLKGAAVDRSYFVS